MEYLKKYGITDSEITELEEIYNENIIKFLKENKIFVIEKLKYLQKEKYNIYPILKNNIKIFLEIMPELKRKIEIMNKKNLSKKEIQIILKNEKIYSRIEKINNIFHISIKHF